MSERFYDAAPEALLDSSYFSLTKNGYYIKNAHEYVTSFVGNPCYTNQLKWAGSPVSPMSMRDIRITVVKKVSNADIHGKYAVRGIPAACDTVEVGMEFISKGMAMPPNFCSWAWADIQRDVAHMALGGDVPWMKERGTMICCCTDGLRPVVFKLERL